MEQGTALEGLGVAGSWTNEAWLPAQGKTLNPAWYQPETRVWKVPGFECNLWP